ncbi:hypothetical protein PHMEG_0009659 [Phytophthora megakarya]|uniref:Uncharacterized protein n=1 Tax=Phytophthora megakarya TaxID=4795 RepID=A0A225WHQ8_9STRA|nr:hypothetical protein PHMEG_0009659 [Phytophthora megakarya]
MNTLQTQFPNVIGIGYLFHMNRHCDCAIPEEECHIAIPRGVLDTLTAIEHEQKWGNVWSYFERAYLVLYTVDKWNVHRFNNELIARTNNPIQRFNGSLTRGLQLLILLWDFRNGDQDALQYSALPTYLEGEHLEFKVNELSCLDSGSQQFLPTHSATVKLLHLSPPILVKQLAPYYDKFLVLELIRPIYVKQ